MVLSCDSFRCEERGVAGDARGSRHPVVAPRSRTLGCYGLPGSLRYTLPCFDGFCRHSLGHPQFLYIEMSATGA